MCDIIQRETGRLNDLVTDMVDLSKPKKPMFASIDAARVAREVVALTARSGRAVSDVEVSYSGIESAPIWADGAQLRQMIWNLVRNACKPVAPVMVWRSRSRSSAAALGCAFPIAAWASTKRA